MAKDQEFINRSVAQRMRRLRERQDGSDAVQDQIIDVVIEHSQEIAQIKRQLAGSTNVHVSVDGR